MVIDEGQRRVMRFGSPSGSEQSAVELGNPRAVPIEYVRYALLGLAHHGRPRRMLMVGLGGGTFTTLVHRAMPEMIIDAVEVDAIVVAAARAHFGLRDDDHYRVHVADAADWMARGQGEQSGYDYILLDAYAGEGIPEALGTPAFFRAVARRLAPGGVVAINIAELHLPPDPERVPDPPRWARAGEAVPSPRVLDGLAVARAFASVLQPFDCRRTPVDGNVLLFAADGPRPGDRDATRRWLAAWDARGATNFSLASLAAQPARNRECAQLGFRATAP
jgi:predicted O-methyltransferase YrrM